MEDDQEIVDFPKIHIFKDNKIGDVWEYVGIDGSNQKIEVIDVDKRDRTLVTVKRYEKKNKNSN